MSRLREQHEAGLDVLGGSSLGITDFVPWLGAVGKIAGGLLGGSDDKKTATGTASTTSNDAATKLAVAQALAAQKQRDAEAKAEADAKRSWAILYGVLGALGVGATVYVVTKK